MAMGDVMVLREAVAKLAEQLGTRCLTTCSMNLANELIKLGRDIQPSDVGITAIGITAISHIAIRTWPMLKHFELDLFSIREVDAETITRWARETLGATVWACESYRR